MEKETKKQIVARLLLDGAVTGEAAIILLKKYEVASCELVNEVHRLIFEGFIDEFDAVTLMNQEDDELEDAAGFDYYAVGDVLHRLPDPQIEWTFDTCGDTTFFYIDFSNQN